MSRQTARLALDQFCGRPSLVLPSYAGQPTSANEIVSSGMLADLRELSVADPTKEAIRWHERKEALVSAYGFNYTTKAESKPFAFAEGKAIIPIHGILINRFAYSWSFITGYNFIRNQALAVDDDPDVDGVVFDINSYGGTCAGCYETSDALAAIIKPTIGVIDANCFSAAYMLACRLDKLVCTPSGECGSIGVVQMHMDVSGALEKAGVKISFQFAGNHKLDGNPYQPLSDAALADRKEKIDALYEMFVEKVVSGRSIDAAAVRATQARCYSAENALSVGLIDAIQTPDDAVSVFFTDNDDDLDLVDSDEIELATTQSEDDMAVAPTNTPAPVAAPGLTPAEVEASNDAARNAERARVKGIQTHAEAADRPKLAAYLAMETSMKVEKAGAILSAAAKETVTAPAASVGTSETVTEKKSDTNFFSKAMDNTPNPNVGAAGSEESNVTPAQRILATQRKAGGAVPVKTT